MDNTILKKLKIKPGMTGRLFHAPPDYPGDHGLIAPQGDMADFVHLFVTSRADFAERFVSAAAAVAPDGLLWLSYPKSTAKAKFDINRDSLWDLVLAVGWNPVAQVALDETWSAVRLKRNLPGVVYEKPANMRK